MAANTEEENVVEQLQKEVETLRKMEVKLRSQEVCCQKAKELFLLKHSTTNQRAKEKSKIILPKECQKDMQFSEVLQLLVEIKKLKRRHLMLQYQLHSEEVKREVGVLDDIVKRQSEILVGLKTQDTSQVKKITPLAFWYSKMVQIIKQLLKENHDGKFSKMNRLFYNVHYKSGGEKEPCDLLAETIHQKSKRSQRTKDDAEKLQFFTCYKGFCIKIVISKTSYDVTRNEPEKNGDILTTDLESYRCYSDIGLEDLQEHLTEQLSARKSPDVFVREYVWKEVEKFAS